MIGRTEVRIKIQGQVQIIWTRLIKRELCFHPRNILRASPNDGGASNIWATANRQVSLPLASILSCFKLIFKVSSLQESGCKKKDGEKDFKGRETQRGSEERDL